ncbi:unnamed protein product [Gordionus sp. m RMFG-2023]
MLTPYIINLYVVHECMPIIYRKLQQKENRTNINQTSIQPGNMKIWTNPFDKSGVELLFDNIKSLNINLPDTNLRTSDWSMQDLIKYMKDNLLKERPEFFVQDWELIGESNYIIKPNDIIMFISTLHGG